ncbi:MAG: hypothetical protein WB662_15270 [Methyloceanibacter sp.]
MLDTNIWNYFALHSSAKALRTTAELGGVSVIVAPSTLYEALRVKSTEERAARAKLITDSKGAWRLNVPTPIITSGLGQRSDSALLLLLLPLLTLTGLKSSTRPLIAGVAELVDATGLKPVDWHPLSLTPVKSRQFRPGY